MTVRELVAQGRYPYQTWYRQWTQEDQDKVNWALQVTGIIEFGERLLESLSGGQRQRVWIAMALAQGTSILLLDEPTTYLDLAHQVEILDLLIELNRSEQCTIVMVLHDLNQAARYADHLIVLNTGVVLAEGVPQEIMTENLIRNAFDLECRIIVDPVSGTPLCLPLMKYTRTNVLEKENQVQTFTL